MKGDISMINDYQQFHPLYCISPLDGRYYNKTKELRPYVSEAGLIQRRVMAECLYFQMLSSVGVIRQLTATEVKLLKKIHLEMSFEDLLSVKEIEKETNHDVKSVEVWLRNYFSETTLADLTGYFHFSLTSEDINNVAYRLQLQNAKNDIIVPLIDEIIKLLMGFATKYKSIPMLGRTHGQAAIPTTVGKEFSNFAIRLARENQKLRKFKLTGKINGAIGCYNAQKLLMPNINWFQFSKEYCSKLGLKCNLFTTQINAPEDIIECFQIIQRINGITLDFCQDNWRYISDDWFKQKKKEGETGSSTMAQKVNPIDGENSEANSQMSSAIIAGMAAKLSISRLQRDLTDSSTLRNIGTILGYSLVSFKSVLAALGKISPNETVINTALENNWAILSEAVQLFLKMYSSVEDPYTLVKNFFRGEKINQEQYLTYVETLPVESEIKQILKELTPFNYLGLTENLVILAEEEIMNCQL